MPPPSYKPKQTPPYFKVYPVKGGYHWTLIRPEAQLDAVLAGHMGPNATTRAGAEHAIEKFRELVANATITQAENA